MSSRKLCDDCTRIECVKGCTCDCHSIKSTKKWASVSGSIKWLGTVHVLRQWFLSPERL